MAVVNILVVGAGQMGSGIAQVCAAAGHQVMLHDIDRAAYERGRTNIEKNLARAVDKGKTTRADADALLGRIASHADLTKPVDVAFAIEAASEHEALKKSIFKTLDAATPPNAVLASNTSSISITKLGAVTKRAGNVIGMHFM